TPVQQPGQAVIALDAARLVIYPVLRFALLGELLLGGPRPRPNGRILGRDLVIERSRSRPRPAFDQVQVFARTLEIGLRTEIRHVDDECIALPVAARVAIPLANIGRQMRTPVHDDVALPSLPLTYVVEHRDAPGSLHDSLEADAIADRVEGAELG